MEKRVRFKAFPREDLVVTRRDTTEVETAVLIRDGSLDEFRSATILVRD